MTNYAADPRFEAFNALLPYRPYEDGGRALAVQLEDSPLSAIVTRPHDNTAAPGVGENVVASGSNGNSHRVMDDGTRASLIDVGMDGLISNLLFRKPRSANKLQLKYVKSPKLLVTITLTCMIPHKHPLGCNSSIACSISVPPTYPLTLIALLGLPLGEAIWFL